MGWWVVDKMKILCTGGSGFIGTHLIDSLLANNIEFINIDIAKPKKQTHDAYWCECNILDLDHLKKVFGEFQPSHVIHLAARATMEGKSLDDFRDNTVGTANVLDAIQITPSVTRTVITSSQHVRKPGSGYPKNDNDYEPHGLYGKSKVITEELTRNAKLACFWTIIRPTTIWGPLHPFLPSGLWRLMKQGWYFHPNDDKVLRSYGYVKNVVWQIERILEASEDIIGSRIFYLGEKPIMQTDWIDAFSVAISGHKVTKLPKEFIHLLAYVGDSLNLLGIRFPMNSPRYFNLTTTNPVPIEPTYDAFGVPPYSFMEGIQGTVQWLETFGIK
jgi:GlcNAc-P-P-Und epimerase